MNKCEKVLQADGEITKQFANLCDKININQDLIQALRIKLHDILSPERSAPNVPKDIEPEGYKSNFALAIQSQGDKVCAIIEDLQELIDRIEI